MKRWIIAIVLVAALVGGGWWYWKSNSNKNGETRYRTAKVERGDVVQTVRANGLVTPIRLVDVGTQVNGPINKLYVDFNDLVKSGDLVAQIDPTTYEAKIAQDTANQASILATVEQTKAKLVQAEKELIRSKKLGELQMLSETDVDAAIATRDALAAQLKANLAAVEQSKATLQLSRANLNYTTIRSPVDGVVISRNVSEGQTVVASLNAMVLFRIATDLKTMQVEASVPEADIGHIAEGQQVTFTVDAYDTTFTGSVVKVRMSATTVQNVVTYPVIVMAANPDNKLFPGMTADLIITVALHTNVLKVPGAALRFKPEEKPAGDATVKAKRSLARSDHGPRVWIEKNDEPGLRPVPVSLGISDGSFTEILDTGALAEGQEVMTGLAPVLPGEKTVNPFVPQMPGTARRAAR